MYYKKYFNFFLFFSITNLYCMEETKKQGIKEFFNERCNNYFKEVEKTQEITIPSDIKDLVLQYYCDNQQLKWNKIDSYKSLCQVNDIVLSETQDKIICALGKNSFATVALDRINGRDAHYGCSTQANFLSVQSYNISDNQYVLLGSDKGDVVLRNCVSIKDIVRIKHGNLTNAIALDVANKKIITGSSDKNACVWDCKGENDTFVLNPKCILTLPHDGIVEKVAISKDGLRITTASSDGKARVFDAQKGNVLCLVEHDHQYVNFAHLVQNDTQLISASDDGTVRLTDIATNKEIARISVEGFIFAVCVSDDDKVVAIGTHKSQVRVWDFVNNKLLLSADLLEPSKINSAINYVSLTANASLCAACTHKGDLFIWNITTNKLVSKFEYSCPVLFSLLTKNGEKLVTIFDKKKVVIRQQYTVEQADLRKLLFLWLLVKKAEANFEVCLKDICKHLPFDYKVLLKIWKSFHEEEQATIWVKCRIIIGK
jgi:WD40 repeat protein